MSTGVCPRPDERSMDRGRATGTLSSALAAAALKMPYACPQRGMSHKPARSASAHSVNPTCVSRLERWPHGSSSKCRASR
eukprot:7376251-Prymnesium_polylepis.1